MKAVNALKINALAIACAFSMSFAKSHVSEECIDELIELPSTKEDFDIMALPGELVASVGKVKSCELPIIGFILCPGSDDEVIDIGLSVGCVKELSKNPGGLTEFIKDFIMRLAPKKAAEFLEVEPNEIPANIKDLENFIFKEAKKQAVKKLDIDESEIPKDKSQLSAFIKSAAEDKFDDEIPDSVENLIRAANILEMLNLANEIGAPITGKSIKKKSSFKIQKIGLRAGVNNSIMEGLQNNPNIIYNYKLGFQGGLVFDISYFQAGLMLFQKGAVAEQDISDNLGRLYTYQEISLYYVEVPLMFSYKTSSGLSFDAGAYIARGIKQDRGASRYELSGIYDSDETRASLDNKFSDTNFSENDYGIKLNIGIEFGGGFYAGIFGNYGLAKNEETSLHSIGLNLGYNL